MYVHKKYVNEGKIIQKLENTSMLNINKSIFQRIQIIKLQPQYYYRDYTSDC